MANETTETTEKGKPTLTHVAKSDIGLRREENQDSFGIIEQGGTRLFMVADGMGGVRGGALASQLAVETVKQFLSEIAEPNVDDVRRAIEKANAEIFAKGAADQTLAGMGTTFVAVFFSGTELTVLNVGDSRAYRIGPQRIDRLTEDHTLVMELLKSGTIDAEQAKNHPVSHMLTRSLGPAPEVEVDAFPLEQSPYRGQIYLLCSDGLYNLVKEHEILSLMRENLLETGVEKLIELANQRGGTDNITVLAIETGEGFPEAPPEEIEVALDDATTVTLSSDTISAALAEGEESVMAEEADSAAANGAASGMSSNGAAAHAVDPEITSKVSIDSLRSSYAEGLAAEKEKAKPGKAAEARTKSGRPTNMPILERAGLFSSTASALLCLLGAALGGGMLGVLLSAPESLESADGRTKAQILASEMVPGSVSQAIAMGRTEGNAEVAPPAESLTGGLASGTAFATVDRRRRTLQARLQQLDSKLAAFEQPMSGALGKTLSEASEVRAQLEERLSSIRTELDGATRRLGMWTGRQMRLESTEPINLVAEVAVNSPDVREKKAAFENATWTYLKETERLEYAPNDSGLASRVVELARQRNDKREELIKSLRSAVSNGILEAQQAIAELTLERDRVEAEIRSLEETLTFARLIASGDPNVREARRAELKRERDQVSAELTELMRFADSMTPADSMTGAQGRRKP